MTLVGAGGVGKTRLGVAAASELLHDFADGIWLVDLAPLSDPALLPQTVSSSLGVREVPGHLLIETLTDSLRGKQLLLLLDNCEHMVQAARHLVECVLHAAPKVWILATSRHVLGIAGERVFRVAPLRVPEVCQWDSTASVQDCTLATASCESVILFIERAVAVLPTFALTNENASSVAHICQRMDGIPLAIELAAARINLLNPGQIAARLDDAFRLLTRANHSSLPHHHTLRATIDWSYEALSEKERTLLRRLSVFAGGFDPEAVEAVCVDKDQASPNGIHPACVLDVLSDLIDKSLVALKPRNGGTRPYLLEIVRQYARDKLREAGETEPVTAQHLDYFTALAEAAEPKLSGSEQRAWLSHLEMEHDNLLSALEWSLQGGDTGVGLQSPAARGLLLTAAVWQFWYLHGYLAEGEKWLRQALERSGLAPAGIRAKLLTGAGSIAFSQGNYPLAFAWHEQALACYRELEDLSGSAFALNNLGMALVYMGDYSRARLYLEESLSLYRHIGHKWGLAVVLGNLGSREALEGRLEESISCFEESLAFSRDVGDARLIAFGLHNLGDVARYHGDFARARNLLEESLALTQDLGERSVTALTLNILGLGALGEGNLEQATARLKASLELSRDIGEKRVVIQCLEGFAWVASQRQDVGRAARLFAANQSLREQIGLPLPTADRPDHDRYLAMTRAHSCKIAIDEASTEGLAMTMEEAIAHALEPY